MGGLRRRMRREARQAAKELIRQGMPARSIGRIVEDERVNRVLLRVVEEMEKQLDGKESEVTVREGLAAIKEIRAIRVEQQKTLENDAARANAEMTEEEIEENEVGAGLALPAHGAAAGAQHAAPACTTNAAEGSLATAS